MKKSYFFVVILFFSMLSISQEQSALWEDHYSYLNIKDVVQGNGKVYAAAENAIFTYDILTNEIETISTVQGLSGEFISTIHFSEIYGLLLIGYENGLIEIYNPSNDDVLAVVDIVDKATIPPDNKQINHFNEFNNVVYIATDFGISVFDLEALEFGDTYFLGNGGSQIRVPQTTVFEGNIYAACLDSNGIKRASIDNENLVDFQEWNTIVGGNILAIQAVNDKLYVTRANRYISELIDTSLIEIFQYPTRVLDFKESNGNLIVTIESQVYKYDSNLNLLALIETNENYATEFSAATCFEDEIYIGTNDLGVLKTTLNNPLNFEEINPNGPIRNNAFSIQADLGNVWMAYGDYTLSYNPAPGRRYGISRLVDSEWINISYDTIFASVGGEAFNLNAISINPSNPIQAFISSFQHGILEVNGSEIVQLFNESNSGLESLIIPSNPSFKSIRVSGSTFDRNGLLWSMTARVDKPLKSYDPETGQWQGFDFTEIIPNGLTDEAGFSDVVVGPDGTKWIGGLRFGLIGFNDVQGNLIKNIKDEAQSNLPDPAIKALAIDQRNHLWIGTIKGLRVLYETSNFFTDEVTTRRIIILEDGIPKELLEQQYISDIKVDGSNNKWVSTIGAGVFYFSSDGQETIYHFTKDNSPLPSNNIIDLSIDSISGVVYIATDRGLLSFRSGGSSPTSDLSDAYVYPNPVRPSFNLFDQKVKIKDISENCNIKITDIEGNLVAEAQSNINQRFKGYNLEIDGGTAFWNGKNLSNNTVRSGVYLVMISDLDTFETKVIKLMVVR